MLSFFKNAYWFRVEIVYECVPAISTALICWHPNSLSDVAATVLGGSERFGVYTQICAAFFLLVRSCSGYKADPKLWFVMIFQNSFILDYPVEAANKGVLSSFTIKTFCVLQH